jgi:hypothetical protein
VRRGLAICALLGVVAGGLLLARPNAATATVVAVVAAAFGSGLSLYTLGASSGGSFLGLRTTLGRFLPAPACEAVLVWLLLGSAAFGAGCAFGVMSRTVAAAPVSALAGLCAGLGIAAAAVPHTSARLVYETPHIRNNSFRVTPRGVLAESQLFKDPVPFWRWGASRLTRGTVAWRSSRGSCSCRDCSTSGRPRRSSPPRSCPTRSRRAATASWWICSSWDAIARPVARAGSRASCARRRKRS